MNNKQKEILAHCSAAEVNWSPIMLKRQRFPTHSSPMSLPWDTGPGIQVYRNTERCFLSLSVKEELVCELSEEPDPYKLMGSDVTHPRVSNRDVCCHSKDGLHNFGKVVDIRGCPRRLEEG